MKENLSQNPIFIVGFPRSGTTLLQSLLCTQKGVVSFPETHFFDIIAKTIKTTSNDVIEKNCLKKDRS